MATVYKAIQDHLERVVAIKALRAEAAGEENIAVRFEREARAIARLQHENLIQVYEFHKIGANYYMVMEHVEGMDLFDLLDRTGRLPYDVAAIIAMQAARALDYVHYRNIIHRDIKPANVMISRQGGVKLMDFGIARDQNLEDLTEMGTGLGTPAYMSPEQIIGDKPTPRSDIFSLGVVLYQMVTGRKPFIEDELRSVMHKIRLERHEPARKLNPDVPRELEAIIDKCLEKSPKHRWRNAQVLVMALERFLSKHVDMNYHARLVLFLRSQDIISQLETDQYINTTLVHSGVLSFVPATPHARNTVRRSFIVHSALAGVTALMLGLIHVAPMGANASTAAASPQTGYLQVAAHPWARVFVDGKEIGQTPFADPIKVEIGRHAVVLSHDWYEPFRQEVQVAPSTAQDPTLLNFDFSKQGKLLEGKELPIIELGAEPTENTKREDDPKNTKESK